MKFDPAVITEALRGSFFGHYCLMVQLIDEVPGKLSQWAESCPCHGSLHGLLSPYCKNTVLKEHFKNKMSTCPMAGKRAPELVTGKLQEVMDEIWAAQESELHRVPIYPGAAPPTQAERAKILADFWLGKSLVMTSVPHSRRDSTLCNWRFGDWRLVVH